MVYLKRLPTSLPAVLLLLLRFAIPSATLSAQQTLDLPAMIGLTLEEAYQSLGSPAELYVVRGKEPAQDDVVFYYADHLYLFWYENRVWQVRADGRFTGTVFSLPMGVSRRRVTETMGRPILESEDFLAFHIEDRGYPVQIRFYFENDALRDVYCFRGDL